MTDEKTPETAEYLRGLIAANIKMMESIRAIAEDCAVLNEHCTPLFDDDGGRGDDESSTDRVIEPYIRTHGTGLQVRVGIAGKTVTKYFAGQGEDSLEKARAWRDIALEIRAQLAGNGHHNGRRSG